jgi:hypothetical protein
MIHISNIHELRYICMMRMQVKQFAISLTSCWSKERCVETAFHKMCNVAHFLLVIRKNVIHPSQNLKCHSLPVGHRKRCDETAFHKMCNVTHILLIIRKDVISAFNLQNVQCHPQTVDDRKRYNETAFTKCAISLTSCW